MKFNKIDNEHNGIDNIILIGILIVLNIILLFKFKKEPKKDQESELIKLKEDIGGNYLSVNLLTT